MTIREILKKLDYGTSPEASDTVQGWLAAHQQGFGHFIDGAFTDHRADTAIPVENPATGGALPPISAADADDIDHAVKAARAALPTWQATRPEARARYLYALARHIQKRERFLAVLETIDNGKPIRETRDIDLPLVARHFYHHAGWAASLPALFPAHRPLGVCAQVIPWNFPLLMLAWKVAPALAAGNTVVLKPAEQTPLTALAFAEICAGIGLPPGVVNIVTGAGETGAALVAHEGVDKVAFTGSTEVGRMIRRQTAGQGKAITLELGGKSPFIVFSDADFEAAIEGVVDGIWFNQGQVCCAGSRLFVQEPIAQRFAERLRERMTTLRVGDPLDKSTDIGAIISHEQHQRITNLIAQGKAEGATLHSAPTALPDKGHFHAPGFFTGAASASTLQQVEIFGPIATFATFRTPAEAVELANNTAYGLAASVWSQNLDIAMDLAARIRAGVIWINGTNMLDAGAPFGGMKESGFGREGGAAGMRAYLRLPRPAVKAAKLPRIDFDAAPDMPRPTGSNDQRPGIDRTLKLYIGGRQQRPDSGASYTLRGMDGAGFSQAGLGNRKDSRNAVEAATKAGAWSAQAGHNRAQVIWFMAENLAQRQDQFAHGLALAGHDPGTAKAEVSTAIDRLTVLAGLADKLAGTVQSTRARHVTLAMNAPWGIVGLTCPATQPLLGMVSAIGALIAMGNRVVAIPSPAHAWTAGDFAHLCDSSDVPDGVVNLISGDPAVLAPVLADHDGVDALLHCADASLTKDLEARAAGNLKPVQVLTGIDWAALPPASLLDLVQTGMQVKTIWVPYGA